MSATRLCPHCNAMTHGGTTCHACGQPAPAPQQADTFDSMVEVIRQRDEARREAIHWQNEASVQRRQRDEHCCPENKRARGLDVEKLVREREQFRDQRDRANEVVDTVTESRERWKAHTSRCIKEIEAAREQFKAITSDFPGLTGPLVDLFKDPS